MKKNVMNWMLMAAMMLGLGWSVTSCKDDDDTGDKTQAVDSVEGLLGTVEEEHLRDLICLWTDTQRDELTGSWASQTYDVTVGHVLDESQPFVRAIEVDSIEAADDYAIAAFATLGINSLSPNGFSYDNPDVGKVSYNHTNDPNTLAVIDVEGIRQLPTLQQIRLVKSLPDNIGERPYYGVGDIVKYQNRFYVCVSEHKYKEQARFINFTRDQNVSTGTFGWLGVGKDTVYNAQMASFETLAGWIENILLCDNAYNGVLGALADKGYAEQYDIVEQMVPRSDTLRALLAAQLFDLTGKVFDIAADGSPIAGCEFYYIENYRQLANRDEGDPDINIVAPRSLLLANKVRYAMGMTWDQWVPYVHCVWNKEFGTYYGKMLEDASQSTLDAKHFTWQCKQIKSHKMYDIQSGAFRQKDKYWICYNAIYWQHKTIKVGQVVDGIDNRTPTNYLLNFTKDWTHHPKPIIRRDATRVPFNWTTRNITSQELTFTDDGSKNKKLETVHVTGL